MEKIPADHFCGLLHINVNNARLSDSDFREFVRNTLGIVVYTKPRLHLSTEKEESSQCQKKESTAS